MIPMTLAEIAATVGGTVHGDMTMAQTTDRFADELDQRIPRFLCIGARARVSWRTGTVHLASGDP